MSRSLKASAVPEYAALQDVSNPIQETVTRMHLHAQFIAVVQRAGKSGLNMAYQLSLSTLSVYIDYEAHLSRRTSNSSLLVNPMAD